MFDEISVEQKDKLYLSLEYNGEEEYVIYMRKRGSVFRKIAIKAHILEDELYCYI